ncbi:hypothetical protein DYH09_02060 [bacterium CPR1]|nr:hypothetical protein [bacterium CPR1]
MGLLIGSGILGLVVVGFFALLNKLAGTRINGWAVATGLLILLGATALLRTGGLLMAAACGMAALLFLTQAIKK